jgi:hypothetical protein
MNTHRWEERDNDPICKPAWRRSGQRVGIDTGFLHQGWGRDNDHKPVGSGFARLQPGIPELSRGGIGKGVHPREAGVEGGLVEGLWRTKEGHGQQDYKLESERHESWVGRGARCEGTNGARQQAGVGMK